MDRDILRDIQDIGCFGTANVGPRDQSPVWQLNFPCLPPGLSRYKGKQKDKMDARLGIFTEDGTNTGCSSDGTCLCSCCRYINKPTEVLKSQLAEKWQNSAREPHKPPVGTAGLGHHAWFETRAHRKSRPRDAVKLKA